MVNWKPAAHKAEVHGWASLSKAGLQETLRSHCKREF
ncbi:hypothetical protein POX_a00686 [Penicillium oxalicum]|nr:hypothetical protein POX_a00686 [Penicillium oxalicum]KAI2794096.1 hypothetical protein POX_a00686 [Penicillium oxalicum]